MSKTKKKKKKKKRSKVLRCDNINKKGPGLPKLTMKPSLILSMILNFMQNFKNFAKVKFRDILLTGTGHRDRRLNRDCPCQTGTYGRSRHRQVHLLIIYLVLYHFVTLQAFTTSEMQMIGGFYKIFLT